MRIVRVRVQGFRGFDSAEITVDGHVAVVGEPRAGRSDLITAIRRVLDPKSTTARVDPLDVHRPSAGGSGTTPPLTEVELTLIELGSALEQLLDKRLVPVDPITGKLATKANSSSAVLGLQLCYRLRYDETADVGEHWVDYPHLSDPAAGTFVRAPRLEREALPFIALRRTPPLQLRSEGLLRALVEESDPAALGGALDALTSDIGAATDTFSAEKVIRDQVAEVLSAGAALLLELTDPNPENKFGFIAEDGSLAALLRSVQPAVELDGAGTLPLTAHGSTAVGILTAAEGIVSATAPEAIVVVDDFADDLDAASAEYLAASLRRHVGQVWLSTRRPGALRAFRPEEVVRLTRSHGHRMQHQLPPTTDRKERGVRRQLQHQLLHAMSARSVAVLEGPHDAEGYGAIADRRLRVSGSAPPAAFGIRLVAPPGSDGGKDRLPEMARLAAALGFHVRVVIDNDDPVADAPLIATLVGICEAVIVLPPKTAIERALVAGLTEQTVRDTLAWLSTEYSLGLTVAGLSSSELPKVAATAIKSKGGLHQPWVDALPANSSPPIARRVLDALIAPAPVSKTINVADSP